MKGLHPIWYHAGRMQLEEGRSEIQATKVFVN